MEYYDQQPHRVATDLQEHSAFQKVPKPICPGTLGTHSQVATGGKQAGLGFLTGVDATQ